VVALLAVVGGSHVEGSVLSALRCLESLAEAGPAVRGALLRNDALVLLRRQWRNWWASPERGAAASLCARLSAEPAELAAAFGAPPTTRAAATAALAPLRGAASPDAVAEPLAALRRWACCGSRVRSALVDAGAVPLLTPLLTSPAAAEAAADTLAELCAQPGLEELQRAPHDFDDSAAARSANGAGALPHAVAALHGAAAGTSPLLAEVCAGLLYDLLRAGGAACVRDLARHRGLEALAALVRGAAGPGAAAVAANVACWLGGSRFGGGIPAPGGHIVAADATAEGAWAAAGGCEALLALAEGAGRNDHGAHAAAVALGHFIAGDGRLSQAAVALLPPQRVAGALLPLLRGHAGVGATRHAASTTRHLLMSEPHSAALVEAGAPAAAVAALAAALREPLFPPRSGAGGVGGDGTRGSQHHLHTVISLLYTACRLGFPAYDDAEQEARKRDMQRHVCAAMVRAPGALAGAAHITLASAGARSTTSLRRGLDLLSMVCAADADALLLDGHFAFGAAVAAHLALNALTFGPHGHDVAGVDCAAPAALMSLTHPPTGREVAAAASLAHLSRWYSSDREPHPLAEGPPPPNVAAVRACRRLLAGGARLEALMGALVAACCGGGGGGAFDAWHRTALVAAVGAATHGSGMLRRLQLRDAASAPAAEQPGARPAKRQRRGQLPPDDDSGSVSDSDVDAGAEPTVFIVAGVHVRVDAAALARSSRLVARLLADAPPGRDAAPVPLPPVAGVPDAMQPALFRLAVRHARSPLRVRTFAVQHGQELPLWVLAAFLEMDTLQDVAVAALEDRGLLRHHDTLLAAWEEAARRPEADGLQEACARGALTYLALGRPHALLARMQAAEDAPGALTALLARVMRTALLDANVAPGGPWGDEHDEAPVI
jgi:hypothetical protein